MREIKFRIWDKDLRKMRICGRDGHDSMQFINNIACYYNLQNGCGSLPDGSGTYDLMQYTGFKDEHGKEVYEKDIVWCPWKDEKFIVEWDEIGTGFSFHNVNDKKRTHGIDYYEFEDMCASLGFEVIGNIYENPELLEWY